MSRPLLIDKDAWNPESGPFASSLHLTPLAFPTFSSDGHPYRVPHPFRPWVVAKAGGLGQWTPGVCVRRKVRAVGCGWEAAKEHMLCINLSFDEVV